MFVWEDNIEMFRKRYDEKTWDILMWLTTETICSPL